MINLQMILTFISLCLIFFIMINIRYITKNPKNSLLLLCAVGCLLFWTIGSFIYLYRLSDYSAFIHKILLFGLFFFFPIHRPGTGAIPFPVEGPASGDVLYLASGHHDPEPGPCRSDRKDPSHPQPLRGTDIADGPLYQQHRLAVPRHADRPDVR